jgi:DNA-binding winged helix-turn-helix (wHTH) protein
MRELWFGSCRLDCEARTLVCRGREVHLAPKAFEVLRVLVDNRPRALSKAELLERVWPGVFVADDSLAKVVSQLRKAIGDDNAAPVIRTVRLRLCLHRLHPPGRRGSVRAGDRRRRVLDVLRRA